MKKYIVLAVLIPAISFGGRCLDLKGTWVGMCDRDGVVKEETIHIRQNSCQHINFYGVDYKIGMPYEVRGENLYENTVSVYNLYWGRDRESLYFDVDRVRWMKARNQVSTGEGIGVIRLHGDEMSYSRSYSARSREGEYTKSTRKCNFVKKGL